MDGAVLMEVGQRGAEDVQDGGQVGEAEPASGSQDHVEPCAVDEIHDDGGPLLRQGHHLPHGHQARMTQDAQIGQSP